MRTVVIACIGRLLIRMIAESIAADARSVFTLDARFNRRLLRFFTANFAENIMRMFAGLILERDIAISFVPLVFTGRIFAFPIELRRVGLVFCKTGTVCPSTSAVALPLIVTAMSFNASRVFSVTSEPVGDASVS